MNFNVKLMIINICELVKSNCLKMNNTLTVIFKDEFPEMILSQYHPFFCLVYNFILLIDTIVQNCKIELILEGDNTNNDQAHTVLAYIRFRVVMNTPKSVPPSPALLDSCDNLPNMNNDEKFLVKSLIKYISMFGANLDVVQGSESAGNFNVSFFRFNLREIFWSKK